MTSKKSVVLLMSFVLLFCFGCKKHSGELEEVINRINKNFEKINNYIVDYSIKEGDDLIFAGKITFIKPDINRLEIINPQTKKLLNIVYSNKNFKCSYFPQWNEAIREKLVKKTNKKYNFIYYSVASAEEILSLVYNGTIKIGEEEFFKLKATMGSKDKSVPTNLYTFLINASTGCVKKFSYNDDKTGKEVIYEFKNYKINTPINKREIELILPSDTRITQLN